MVATLAGIWMVQRKALGVTKKKYENMIISLEETIRNSCVSGLRCLQNVGVFLISTYINLKPIHLFP
jgi:hypothetical protein